MKLSNLLISSLLTFIFFIFFSPLKANEDFNQWLNSYKKYAMQKGVSKETIDLTLKNAVFLENVCE